MNDVASDWTPPVEFYFRVDFQNQNGQKFQASFGEVSGIGWSFSTTPQKTAENEKIQLPQGLNYSNITLKRPVAPLSEDFAKWVNSCLSLTILSGSNDNWIKKKSCDVIIKLLDNSGKPLAAWACYHSYPVKYSIGGLNAANSGLVMETLEITYNRLERVV